MGPGNGRRGPYELTPLVSLAEGWAYLGRLGHVDPHESQFRKGEDGGSPSTSHRCRRRWSCASWYGVYGVCGVCVVCVCVMWWVLCVVCAVRRCAPSVWCVRGREDGWVPAVLTPRQGRCGPAHPSSSSRGPGGPDLPRPSPPRLHVRGTGPSASAG